MSLKQRLNKLLNIENKDEELITSDESLEKINLIRLCVYASIWLFCNITLVGLVVVFWRHFTEVGFNGVNFGKFVVVSHAAIVFGLYKINKKYFKFIVLLKNKLV